MENYTTTTVNQGELMRSFWKRNQFKYVFSSIGSVAGLGYAFANKKKFWGYVGFMMLGSIAFGTIGGIIDFAKNNK